MLRLAVVLGVFLLTSTPAMGQTLATEDEVLKNIWKEAMESSELELLAHELFDQIGPRLTGTPQSLKAHEWAVKKYESWNIKARNEQWGKWLGWERGVTHIDLLEPRLRTLEGTVLAWSPGTKSEGITARFIILADVADSTAFQAWLPDVKGKFVLMSMPQITGRTRADWKKHGLEDATKRIWAEQDSLSKKWRGLPKKYGYTKRGALAKAVESAGAAALITSRWSNAWGTNKIFSAYTKSVPTVDVSMEDYGLLFRLVEHGADPVVRIVSGSKFTGEAPALNTIAEIKGEEKSDEYVMLSAHFDSWDGASGATDNGSGTILMMEALRILRKVYPNPKRTIIVGHWGAEEQGLNGSRAYVEDHPEVVEKLQALFNQDNGTGRVVRMSGSGFLSAGAFLGRWLSRIPDEVTRHIKMTYPGTPAGGGSDHASFLAAGAPAFGIGALGWDYGTYTWHSNRDTYDKLVFDDIRNNVVLAASLIYLASEDPEFMPRDKRILPIDEKTGEPKKWPEPVEPDRAGRLEEKESGN